MRIPSKVLIAGSDTPFQRRPENRDALVGSGDKDEYRVLRRVFALLNLGCWPGPDSELKTKYMECSKNLREQERNSNPPAGPIHRSKAPAEIVNSGDSNCDSQRHRNRLVAVDIFRERNRQPDKQ